MTLDLHDSMAKDPGYDEAWAAEIARRLEKVRNGTAVLYDDDEADRIMFADDDDDP